MRAAGFTLLELLVALAVFALLVLALLHLAGQATRTAALLEEQWLADVVAGNLAVAATLAPAADLRAGDGSTALAGREWAWQREVEPADTGAFVRVELRVRRAGSPQVLAGAELLRDAR
ncbi:type II secretion system minor pseudopilin GspI [Lysobacter sp. GX 14042]|uniref:type II secretion system minor pseudopilin GspI n=1 Tax=Lysobacter sp. GX 14042 TaxID=2907155 RepID=UPI001F3226F6|nr:type II secretion system minor pseudopilin GspI [Lysobacter sp. GX 14042]MCE7033203.1 type II secretion system minor pseudopilin GspI [Lysobacter sp. GX 14042]